MTLPVTEFAILRLKLDVTSLDDPDLKAGLRRVSAEQSAWSGFPLHWFTYSSSGDTFVCILSQWASVAAHQAWIDSPQNQALLQLLLPKLDIFAFCHVDLHASRSEIGLDKVFQAQQISWRKLEVEDRVAKSGEGQRGDARGWAVDAPEPTFYVFRIDVRDDGSRANMKGDGSWADSVTKDETDKLNRGVAHPGGGATGSWTTMSRLDFGNL